MGMIGELLGWGLALILVGVLTMLAGQLYWAFGAWQYRNPEAMAPTPRRIRVAIYSGSAYLALGVAMVVAALWRGDANARAWAFAIALWAALASAVVIIVATRRWAERRDAERTARRAPWKHIVSGRDLEEATELAHAEAAEESPSEPSEAAYGLAYLSLGIHVAVMVIASIVAISLTSPTYLAERRAQYSPTPASPAERRSAQAILNQVIEPTLPVETAPAAGQVVVAPWSYVPTSVLRGRSLDRLGHDPSRLLAGSAIAVQYPSCEVRAVIVSESAGSVRVGFAADAPPAGSPSPGCLPGMVPTFWYPVSLSRPLGDRKVLAPTGTAVDDDTAYLTSG